MTLRRQVSTVLSLLAFISIFYSVGKLGLFLATPITAQDRQTDAGFPSEPAALRAMLFPLFYNLIWVALFVLQHSGLRAPIVKRFYQAIGLDLAERSLYNIASCYSLLLLLKNWKTAPNQYRLWFFDVESNAPLWWFMMGSHVLAWLVVYGGSLMVDLPELVGMKQVYYDVNDLAPPMSYKSPELQDYYRRCRHPSFVGLSVVLWFTNGMTLERCLLAVIWTLYMYFAWNTTRVDLEYHRRQLERKRAELLRVNQ